MSDFGVTHDVQTVLTANIRLIDATRLSGKTVMFDENGIPHKCESLEDFMGEEIKLPVVDAAPVVRCGECEHHFYCDAYNHHTCNRTHSDVLPDDYCSYGKRRESEGE